jgi:hypothetical protein
MILLVAQARHSNLGCRLFISRRFPHFARVNTLVMLSDEQIRAMIDDDLVRAHRAGGLSPERQ